MLNEPLGLGCLSMYQSPFSSSPYNWVLQFCPSINLFACFVLNEIIFELKYIKLESICGFITTVQTNIQSVCK